MKSLRRSDWLAAALLWLAGFQVWSAGASRLGYYADDAGWLSSLPHLHEPGQVWLTMRYYMPGRNLHPLWHYLSYRLVGDPVARLPTLHRLQSSLDALVIAVFYLLLRYLGLPSPAAWLAAAGFAFWPVHGETHFWLESIPMNLLSTLLVLICGATSLAFARGRGSPWLWVLDAFAFVGALFTYDQVFVVLLLFLVLRRRPIALYLPYLAALAFCAWLRLSRGGGPLPGSDRLLGNLRHTFSSTFGDAARDHIGPLLANAAASDWSLAVLLAAAFLLFALYLGRGSAPLPFRWWWPAVAVSFWVAAYAPVWLWYLSPRHQYLPSAGLFTLLAALVRGRLAYALVSLLLVPGIAANRGESRFWEAAFTAKQELFRELGPDLAGKEALVLDSFPFYLGTAFFISPHDAARGVRLLLRDIPVAPGFRGYLGHAPAPGGLFLATHVHDGPESFFFSDGSRILVARFDSWQDGRLRFQKNPRAPLQYELLASRCQPSDAPFTVPSLSARREDDDLLLDLRHQGGVSPQGWLTAVVHFWHWDRFESWDSATQARPVVLSEPAAGGQCLQTLRLRRFPRASRLRVDFFQATRAGRPTLLGRFEIGVQP